MAERIKKISISNAWGEAAKFVAREAALVVPIAIMLIALPSIILGILTPDPTQGETPSFAFWILFLPLVFVTGIGTLAITVLALRSGISVAEALRRAAGRFIVLFVASILLGLAAGVVMLPIVMAIGVSADPESLGAFFLLLLVLLPLFLYVWARLSMMSPVAAAEEANPFGIIKRSWAVTKGSGWKLAAAYLILILAFVILMAVILLVAGILVVGIGGAPEPDSLGSFVMLVIQGILTAAFTLYFQAFLARIYAQLAADQTSGS